jgi:hypothetical protein
VCVWGGGGEPLQNSVFTISRHVSGDVLDMTPKAAHCKVRRHFEEYQYTTLLNIETRITHYTFLLPPPPYVTTKRSFLGAFAKPGKATISIVMSVRPFTCRHGTTRLPLDGCSLHFMSEDFFENLPRKKFD